MNTQLVVCIVIFALTLLSFILNKIPMWVTAMLSLSALYLTGCIDSAGALSGFSNVNTVLMGAMFVVAAAFQRTSMVDIMCKGLMRLTGGSFQKAYLGYLLLAALLTNFIASPMVVYAIISPLLIALCDSNNVSRTKAMFPMMVVCVAACGILPLPTAIQQASQFNGFMESYGFTGMTFDPVYFFIGRWPVMIVVVLWALFIGPKFCPEKAILEISTDKKKGATGGGTQLSPLIDKIGIVIFFATMLALIFSEQLKMDTWFISLVGALLMVLFGVIDQRSALRDIPWDMILLFVGALSLGTGLTNTGAGEFIGNWLAAAVGGTRNNYVLGALFFIVPFVITQFMLNRSVTAVFVPICLLTCQALGANPIGLIMLVQAGSLTAFMTPMATPAVAMCIGEAGYDLKSLVKAGWLISLVIPIIYIFYTMSVFPAF